MKKEEKKKKEKAIDKPVMTDKMKSEAGKSALESARNKIDKACEKAGLTVEKVAKTVANALEAKRVVVQLDNKTGQFVESNEYVDHQTRLKAVERAEVLLDLKPTDRVKIGILDDMSDEDLDKRLGNLLKKGGVSGTT